MTVPVSATLAVNEELARRRASGQDVLALAFGEAGLPPAPVLRTLLADNAGRTDYGPVAGCAELRRAAAGYWERRQLQTDPEMVVAGPGSKALLFAALLAVGGDVVVPQPSWVSYAAQNRLAGGHPLFVPTRRDQGGVPAPELLGPAIRAARQHGREVRSLVLTVPDNPTGTVAENDTLRRVCELAQAEDLVIVCDEIYRDLVHDPGRRLTSAAQLAPEHTIVTTGLSKNLALGGWRLGVARLPHSDLGVRLRAQLLAIGSEIWSAPAQPVQHAAAYAFDEPPELVGRVAASRRLHAAVARAVHERLAAAAVAAPSPQAAFYLYPDFGPVRRRLRDVWGVGDAVGLSRLLLDRFGVGVLPGTAFGDAAEALRIRVATSLLYGRDEAEREAALHHDDPLTLPWIDAALGRLGRVLRELSGGASAATAAAEGDPYPSDPRKV